MGEKYDGTEKNVIQKNCGDFIKFVILFLLPYRRNQIGDPDTGLGKKKVLFFLSFFSYSYFFSFSLFTRFSFLFFFPFSYFFPKCLFRSYSPPPPRPPKK
jgi:hypothetical protein